jgi:hypothetical protein
VEAKGYRAGQKLRGSKPIKETDNKADDDDDDDVLVEVNADRCCSRRSLDSVFKEFDGFGGGNLDTVIGILMRKLPF